MGEDVVQLAQCLLGMHKALLYCQHQIKQAWWHTPVASNAGTLQVEARGSEVRGHAWLHGEFGDSVGHMQSFLLRGGEARKRGGGRGKERRRK